MRPSSFVPLLLVAAVFGCRPDPTNPDERLSTLHGDVALQTNRTQYEAVRLGGRGSPAQYGFTVEAVYRNTTGQPVWLGRCFPDSDTPMYGVRAIEADEAAYDQAWACVGHDEQFLVPPGTARTDVIQVRGPNAWGGCSAEGCLGPDEHWGVLEGRFRLYYDVRLAPGDGAERAPEALRMSNEFVVTLE